MQRLRFRNLVLLWFNMVSTETSCFPSEAARENLGMFPFDTLPSTLAPFEPRESATVSAAVRVRYFWMGPPSKARAFRLRREPFWSSPMWRYRAANKDTSGSHGQPDSYAEHRKWARSRLSALDSAPWL